MGGFQNISPDEFSRFLLFHGLKHIRTKGDHEIWSKTGLLRPVVFQRAINPIPEFILRNNLRVMGCSRKELTEFLRKD